MDTACFHFWTCICFTWRSAQGFRYSSVHIPSSKSHSSLSPEGKWGSQMPSCNQASPGIPRKYMLFSITRDLVSVAPCGVSKRWEMKISDLAFLLTELIPRAERIQNTCNTQVLCRSKVINKKCRCHKKESVSRRDCKPQGESIYLGFFLLKMGGGDSPML